MVSTFLRAVVAFVPRSAVLFRIGPRNGDALRPALLLSLSLLILTTGAFAQSTPIPISLSNLWSQANGDVVPLSGFAGTNTVTLFNDVARLRYTGPDGYLEYQWQRPSTSGSPLFGTLTLNARITGGSGVSLPLATTAALSWTQTATVLSNAWETLEDGMALVRWYQVGSSNAVVRIEGRMINKSLVLTVTCDRRVVTQFNGGVWGGTQQQIYTPYYAIPVRYVPAQNVFVSAFLDWTSTAASSVSDTVATYGALTGGSRNLLQERIIFSAAWHMNEVLANIPNPPSPWLDHLGDKMIVEIWDGPFSNMTAGVELLADQGITNCYVIVHDWQRSGYDNALPSHYPAGTNWGGEEAMLELVNMVRSNGLGFALHENYVDYYPNYDFYNINDISLDSAGNRVPAWYNPGTGIQSYALKPNAMIALASLQSPEIHSRYKTTATFLDVHSAVAPWFHVDFRASEVGAGKAQRVWEMHRALWEYERATHEGPVFGEGGNHWYWSGSLDGVAAQFGTGWPENGGTGAPLHVDFNLLKVHPLQLNHGMGYYERWWPTDYAAANTPQQPMAMLDQYRMQQLVYGHAAFRSGILSWSNVPAAWLEYHLAVPVAERFATARPVQILYHFSGAWTNVTYTAKFGALNNRVEIQYDNGLKLTANGDANTLQAGSWQLPQFGWIAQGAGISAGTTLRNGIISDFADTTNKLFVNARPAADWNFGTNYTGTLGALFRQRLNTNNVTVNFGHVRTSGSAMLQREGNDWVLRTWPRDRDFVLELDARRFGQPSKIQCLGGASSETDVTPLTNGWWTLTLNGSRIYRWPVHSLEFNGLNEAGDIKINLHGRLDGDYIFLASTNLLNWFAVSTNTIQTNPLMVAFPLDPGSPRYFYEAEPAVD